MRRASERRPCSWLIFLTFVSTTTLALPELSESEMDALVERTMAAFQVPGIAVGIVKDDKLVLAKGYGVRAWGKADPVDADTLFGIASNTKGVTATALAMLVDEGKIDWDDAVVKHIPEFRLYDTYVTREFTIRDLLTHRSGLPLGAGDLMWWPNGDFTPAEVLAGLPHLKPSSSFRARYAYNNMLYVVAGEVIARSSGQSWGDFVQNRILNRLGMHPCRVLREHAKDNTNIANPHAVVAGKMHAMHVAGGDFRAAAAAAGIVCNVNELAKWVTLHLRGGKLPNGEALVTERTHHALWSAQTVQPVSATALADTRTQFRAYGLGFGLDDFYGYKRISHSGGLPGMVTFITMIPELKLGLIVLTNQQAYGALTAIVNTTLAAYMSAEEKDWVAIMQARQKSRDDQLAKQEKTIWETTYTAGPTPLPFNAYIGTYRDPWRGDVSIYQDRELLVLKFSRTELLEGTLHHYKDGAFIVRWNDRTMFADAFVRFALNPEGTVAGMTMEAILPSADFSFDFHHLDFVKATAKK